MTTPDPYQSYDLGPFVDEHYAFLRHVLRTNLPLIGGALEFGVGSGSSMRQMINFGVPVLGFDSFQGLPEDWREGFPAGSFACEPPPDLAGDLIIGLFADTLPNVLPQLIVGPGLVHIDCDLYSSTATVLKWVGPHLKPGCYIVFDEWHGYEGCEEHEQRAWKEFAEQSGIRWEVVGHGYQQWGIRIV